MKLAAGILATGLAATALVACGSTTLTTTSTSTGGAVALTVSSPTNGSHVSGPNVVVTGTVTPTNATVQVQGKPASVGNGVFTANATVGSGSTSIDVIASAPGDTPASTTVIVSQPSHSHRSTTGGSRATPGIAHATPGAGANTTSCGNGLSVGPDTTCSFAENVRAEYDRSGPGTYDVYSPVTERSYVMSCGGSPVECHGGNNASVFFP